ncbi:hypothetical protein OC846_004648 [Tilletia horrida]|uniref:Vacuolar protein 14 C-terminal Fig4-binding domain-containing protein n=1 Tax=Tilletia horrida TaxID=155126 RepID=A0AAN6JSK2_9BASI|nr:hypothetical protein OC846_004648 [Tilletia horrida]KAK0560351.1 hypothetical protein OC861_006313 [Tilletia horrida]
MDPSLQKALLDRQYEKRKQATLDLERQVRECLAKNELARIDLIVHQLCALLASSPPHNLNARNGGLIGLAGIAIALGVRIAPYLEQIVPPVLTCFADPDNKIRYFACESFYNIAKVCKGEILIYFNDIFDALSKLAADSELSVKNGAELLDRLMKDIVCEAAPHYVSQHQDIALIRARQDQALGRGNLGGEAEMDIAREKSREAAWLLAHPYSAAAVMRRGQGHMPPGNSTRSDATHNTRDRASQSGAPGGGSMTYAELDREMEAHTQTMTSQHAIAADSLSTSLNRAFSLARFIPLLAERLYVISPFTRNFLVGWITTLDSVPDLELVSYLPRILDPLLKYLADPNMDVRVATKGVLSQFLLEAKEAAVEAVRREDEERRKEMERKRSQSVNRTGLGSRGRHAALIDSIPALEVNSAQIGGAGGAGDDGENRAAGGSRLPRPAGEHVPAKKAAAAGKSAGKGVPSSAMTASALLSASSAANAAHGDEEDDGRATPVAGGSSSAGLSRRGEDDDDGAKQDDDDDDDDEDGGEDGEDEGYAGEDSAATGLALDGEGRGHAGSSHRRRKEKEQWIPKQEVRIDYAAVMDILIAHISDPDEEIQATVLQWIAEFLHVIQSVVLPFTPRLIPAILPNLAHHSPAIKHAAHRTNDVLYRTILELPPLVDLTSTSGTASASPATTTSPQPPTPASGARPGRSGAGAGAGGGSHASAARERERSATISSPPLSPRLRIQPLLGGPTARAASGPGPSAVPGGAARAGLVRDFSADSTLTAELDHQRSQYLDADAETEAATPFDYTNTVHALTLQLLDEHEETRVTALQWLLMLHTNAPRKILAMDDGTSFPALLKTLSDPSEEVIRADLRLLAQICSASEDEYFFGFMRNLLHLFATDRRLLETRGSLIVRQLCASLNTDRIMRTLAEILERDEDVEFASIMVTNLNIIIITAPELAEFRRRLKSLDTRDGVALFTSVYKSWCHNAVATFTLCLLAGAYEHAFNLLQIFASELEMTVPLLVQIDKLVQLLESPIFTSLRLQLLEPERYPYLFKCLYGLLMLLPQSSAFVTLRNRLNAVSTMMGFVNVVPAGGRGGAGGGGGPGLNRGTSSSTGLGLAGVGGGGGGGGAGSGSATSSGTNSQGGAGSSGNASTSIGAGASGSGTTTSKMAATAHVRWNELLGHFRSVQMRHERLRRQNLVGGGSSYAGPEHQHHQQQGMMEMGLERGGGGGGRESEASSVTGSKSGGGGGGGGVRKSAGSKVR